MVVFSVSTIESGRQPPPCGGFLRQFARVIGIKQSWDLLDIARFAGRFWELLYIVESLGLAG